MSLWRCQKFPSAFSNILCLWSFLSSLGESGKCSNSVSPLGRTAVHFQKVGAKIHEKNHPSLRPEECATPQGRLLYLLDRLTEWKNEWRTRKRSKYRRTPQCPTPNNAIWFWNCQTEISYRIIIIFAGAWVISDDMCSKWVINQRTTIHGAWGWKYRASDGHVTRV